MFEMDHVAVPTKDVPGSVKYYVEQFGAEVLYADATWAFLRIGQGKLALVSPQQHPPHVAFRVDLPTLQAAALKAGQKIDLHRDGTRGIYVEDPAGNVLELIHYPAGQTAYDAANNRGPVSPDC
ncbi:MAG TPA: VOC family protein [Phycisphaerae bacterium]|nr:VOC family protein [Phycisphaerae bacterium]